jgi:hypothetical protein
VNYIAAQQAAFTYGLAYNPFCSALRDYLDAAAALRAQPAGGGEVLDCGHHNSLMLKSAETGLPLYCELCDALTCARDNASDAADWRAKFGELQADDVARQWLDTMRDLLLPKHEGEWREFVAMVKATDSGVEFKDCRTRTPPESGGQGEAVAWLLTDANINSLQVASIQRLIDRAKHAHHTDLIIRINGQDEHYEADWLKHLVRHPLPPSPQGETK